MRDAYSQLAAVLAEHYSAAASSVRAVGNVSDSSYLSSSLEAPGAQGAPGSSAGGADAASSSSYACTAERAENSSAQGAYAEWRAAQELVRKHLTATTAEGVLEQIEALWPQWTAVGCPLPVGIHAQPARPAAGAAPADMLLVLAPSAAEAAAALRALVFCAFQLPVPARRQLPKHRLVRGLVRALRLESAASASVEAGGGAAPSRLPPAAVSRALWALSCLGGSAFFEAEAEALCSMLPKEPMRRLDHVSRCSHLSLCLPRLPASPASRLPACFACLSAYQPADARGRAHSLLQAAARLAEPSIPHL